MFPIIRTLALIFAICLPTALAQQPLAPLPLDGFVTLQQLVQEFTTAPDAASQKYQGARITVFGRVGQVTQSQDADGDPLTVFLQIPNQDSVDVKAVFGSDDVPGDEVDVKPNDSAVDVGHRKKDGDVGRVHPYFITGEMAAITGTFNGFIAGDVVLENSVKVPKSDLINLLRSHGIPTE